MATMAAVDAATDKAEYLGIDFPAMQVKLYTFGQVRKGPAGAVGRPACNWDAKLAPGRATRL